MKITILVTLVAGFVAIWMAASPAALPSWQSIIQPGPLSEAHTFLADDCGACHTPIAGIDRDDCVSCHAAPERLLARQPTAFHREIGECRGCHLEHRGDEAHPTHMEHALLAEFGRDMIRSRAPEAGARLNAQLQMLDQHRAALIGDRPLDAATFALDCAGCHANEDPHWEFFGDDCVACHELERWTLDAFVHPAPSSSECAQCHQAPGSHYMMHFQMISQQVAGKHKAALEACSECHQTTAWNDIIDVGVYKHH